MAIGQDERFTAVTASRPHGDEALRRDAEPQHGGRRALGARGEHLVALWYQAEGYEVVGRNWRCRLGELDIVARKDRLTVFCEVKTRSSMAFGGPAEAVGPLKQLRARRLAGAWFAAGDSGAANQQRLAARRPGGGPVRFDVACVMGAQVEVIEDAF